MRMLRQGCLFLYIEYVHGTLLLLTASLAHVDLLHILHYNPYIPLEFVLFCGDLSRS